MRILTLLLSAGIILIVLGVALGIGAKITQDVSQNLCSGDATLACSGNGTGLSTANDAAYSAAANSTLAIANLASWQGTISTVVAAVVIIGLLLTGFGGFLSMKGGGGI